MITKNIRKIYELIGELRNKNLSTSKYPHSVFIPAGTYSPWITDISFNQIYDLIKDYTLVHRTKCYVIYKLVEEVSKLSGDYIEVGVWRGGTGALIASMALKDKNEGKVYLCDTFTGVVKAGKEDGFYKNKEHSDTSIETVKKLLNKLNLDNTHILQGVFPDETSKEINSKQIKFCHIDVDVYKGAKEITDWVWPFMPLGGIIIYDDFGFPQTNGVTKYVEEQRNNSDRIVIHNLSGQGIIIKIK